MNESSSSESERRKTQRRSNASSTSGTGKISCTPTALFEKCNLLTEKRARRRLGRRTAEIVEIDPAIISCPSTELKSIFKTFLDKLLALKSCPSECFQIVINSLNDLHVKQYPGSSQSDQQNMVNAFLKKLLHQHQHSELEMDMNFPKGLLECELFIMLELYLLRFFPIHLSQTRIIALLRAIYFVSDPTSFRHLLDDVICDEFLDDLPFYLAGIYEELSLNMPLDLQRFQSQEYRQDIAQPEDYRLQSCGNKLRDRLEEFMRSLELEEKEDEEKKENNENEGAMKTKEGKKATREELRTRAPKKPQNRKANISNSDQQKLSSRRRINVIPETPEKKESEQNNGPKGTDELIEQTPIGKIRAASSTGTTKFGKLLRREEERLGKMQIHQQQQQPLSTSASSSTLLKTRSTTIRARRALNVGAIASQPQQNARVAAATSPLGRKRPATQSIAIASKATVQTRQKVAEQPQTTKVAVGQSAVSITRKRPPTPSSSIIASGSAKIPRKGSGRAVFASSNNRSSIASSSVVSFPFSRKS